MQKIRKGDTVVVLAGKDKGRSGEVIKMMPKDDKALVQGVIHLSNLAVADPKDGKATRIGFKTLEDGTKVRVAKRSGEEING